MAPAPSIATSQLRQLIFYHIDNDLLENANFLAQRLHAYDRRNQDSLHLLTLTYLRLRRYRAAHEWSHQFGHSGKHLGCTYVFAQACMHLGRITEGITALEKAKPLWVGRSDWQKHSDTSRRHLPDAAAVYTLMGKLWRLHGDTRKAGDCFVEAHKANPFIWDAFDGLCKVGADLNVSSMFKLEAETTATSNPSHGGTSIYTDEVPPVLQPLAPQRSFNQQVFTPSGDPFGGSRSDVDVEHFPPPNPKGKLVLASTMRHPLSEWDTPVGTGSGIDEDIAMDDMAVDNMTDHPPPAPPRRVRAAQAQETFERPRQPTLRGHIQSNSEGTSAEDAQRKPSFGGHKRTISGHTSVASSVDPSLPPRRSNRLFGQTSATSKPSRPVAELTSSLVGKVDRTVRAAKAATGAKGRTGSTVGRVVSGNRKMFPPDPTDKDKQKRAPSRNDEKSATVPGVTAAIIQRPSAPTPDHQVEQAALTTLLDNFRHLAIGTYATARFDLPRAISTFKALPTPQRETPFVLAQLGKAHYEAADYPASAAAFASLLQLQPSRVDDLEIYSTVLWHLKAEPALAYLCHNLRATAFTAPQTWCALGNAFSLAREHDQAIAAFKRATQLDEDFAYAYTLMGHEYIANDDFDAALLSFRKSVAVDRRGYAGWYGLGKSYERMGRLPEAEQHYRIAASINPSNATLLVCIGVVLERTRNRRGALANYTAALELAPTSALARFKKARVLMQMRRYEEALTELDVLRGQAPDEANVWFLLGKCYKGLGEKSEALRALTTALNLDVKVSLGVWCVRGASVVLTMMVCRLRRLSRRQWRRWMRTRTRRVRRIKRLSWEMRAKKCDWVR